MSVVVAVVSSHVLNSKWILNSLKTYLHTAAFFSNCLGWIRVETALHSQV